MVIVNTPSAYLCFMLTLSCTTFKDPGTYTQCAGIASVNTISSPLFKILSSGFISTVYLTIFPSLALLLFIVPPFSSTVAEPLANVPSESP